VPRDVQLADKLRARGLRVVEVAGWRTRGAASFNPRGFVWHHTAGPRRGNAPSLGICIRGRADLPGPLCNVFQARDGTVYVVAAGRANHAGAGGWAGLQGNSSVYGLEIENVGTSAEPWSEAQLDTAARVAAALAPASLCCMHKEWTPRKVDMHTVAGSAMRARVTKLRGPKPPAAAPPKPAAPKPAAPKPTQPKPKEPVLMRYFKIKEDGRIYRCWGAFYELLTPKQWDCERFFHAAGDQLVTIDGVGFLTYVDVLGLSDYRKVVPKPVR
jgi:hypothetical protein